MICRVITVNRLGKLRDDNDPNCTYEGDNNVILYDLSCYYSEQTGQAERRQRPKLYIRGRQQCHSV